MDRGAWWAAVHGAAKELDTNERLTLSLSCWSLNGIVSIVTGDASSCSGA